MVCSSRGTGACRSMREMGTTAETFGIKRIYDAPADDDGCRVLVDRLWPRGVSKADAQLDLWLKDIAPSAPLRQVHRAPG